MNKIVIASNNKHKVSEIQTMFKEYEILTLNDIEYYDEIEICKKNAERLGIFIVLWKRKC